MLDVVEDVELVVEDVDVVDDVELVVEDVDEVVEVVEVVEDVVGIDVVVEVVGIDVVGTDVVGSDVVGTDVVSIDVVGVDVVVIVVVVVTTAWLTTRGRPAITTVAFLGGPGLGATVRVTVPAPVPDGGWTVIQSTKFCTVQVHVGPVVRPTLRCPPAASTDTPLTLSEKLHCSGIVVVLVAITVDVGGGALVASINSELNDNGLSLQSASVRPPLQRRNCGSSEPPNSRSATHSGVSDVSVPLNEPASSVPTSSPLT